MFEVSGLSMGDLPYEEYTLNTEELHLLKRDAPQVYETYWEALCHFHIYAKVTGWRSGGVKKSLGPTISLAVWRRNRAQYRD